LNAEGAKVSQRAQKEEKEYKKEKKRKREIPIKDLKICRSEVDCIF
jgi:hypothetical protein